MKLIKYLKIMGVHVTTPRKNEMKDVIKVIRSLENRGILLKGTTKKIKVKRINLKIGSVFGSLLKAGLPLMKIYFWH